MKKVYPRYWEGEKVRLFGVEGQGDKYLCEECAIKRVDKGDKLGVPAVPSFMWYMERALEDFKCDDCGK